MQNMSHKSLKSSSQLSLPQDAIWPLKIQVPAKAQLLLSHTQGFQEFHPITTRAQIQKLIPSSWAEKSKSWVWEPLQSGKLWPFLRSAIQKIQSYQADQF